jgi:cytochrome c peroxidase
MKKNLIATFSTLFAVFVACKHQPELPPHIISSNGSIAYQKDLTGIPYHPVPYTIQYPPGFPPIEVPADNPLTVAGVDLGHYLFYDKRLSKNNTTSCGTCHQLRKSFGDGLPLARGAFGTTQRGSPILLNIAYGTNQSRANNFMWDGKFETLEQQHLAPVENPIEMGSKWDDVENMLRNDTMYQRKFRRAFGISTNLEINKTLASKAIGQFVRTLISGYSKFDYYDHPTSSTPFVQLTQSEQNGYDMFFNNTGNFGSLGSSRTLNAECGHCHNTINFTNFGFFNNSLQVAATLNDFTDKGLGAITNRAIDNGKFKAPTLRNIELTAPYMHDGRFTTLEQVIDFYATAHTRLSPNLDNNFLNPVNTSMRFLRDITPSEKTDLVNFLKTFTDTTFYNRTDWADPF